ncbi:MAG: protein phosphatase 2C domain-containing protein [Candidatus Paceibacterota bacterium]
MRHIKLLRPPTESFFAYVKEKSGSDAHGHPQEDALSFSAEPPVFAVADGVTLIQNMIDEKDYPNPSPAGVVSRIFCDSVIKNLEEKYEELSLEGIRDVFKGANKEVEKYNAEQGRTEETVDYWENDLYAATGAFAALKEEVIYWASICDSYVMHIGENGSLLFKSPNCDVYPPEKASTPKDWDKRSEKEKAMFVWKERRNRFDGNGNPKGYGVITGEEAAEKYLNIGSFQVQSGEMVALCTDGFEKYFSDRKFRELLCEWPNNLEEKIDAYTSKEDQRDPDGYGHERTLIVVKF